MSVYLTTTDKAVLHAIRRNRTGREMARKRLLRWAEERGADVSGDGPGVPYSDFLGALNAYGLYHEPVGFGKWRQPNKHGVYTPFKNNKDEQIALRQLRWSPEPIPGLPSEVHSTADAASGQSWLMWPKPFEWEQAAWITYSHKPDKPLADLFGEQWSECLASEFYKAYEGINAFIKAENEKVDA